MSSIVHDTTAPIDDFDLLVASTRKHFDQMVAQYGPRLLKVNAGNLYAVYLGNLLPAEVDEHTCYTCNRFMEQYGDLAFVTDEGNLVSAIWNPEGVPSIYKHSIMAMAKLVAKGKVEGVFYSEESAWGKPLTGKWSHFAVTPTAQMIHASRDLDAYQAHALSKQHFGTLSRGLAQYSRSVVSAAVGLIEAEALERSEKVAGPAMFLLTLHNEIHDKRGAQKDNLVWRAVANSPVSFFTPQNTMIGTLLDDIIDGVDLDIVRRRFAEKMDPLKYQRPQGLPKAGNVAAGEKLVEKLGIAPSLERRFARLEEVQTIWKPVDKKSAPSAKGGVFGHLETKGSQPSKAAKLVAPLKNITFDKFRRTVMPSAQKIELMTESRMTLRATLTAVHADAPPILQWDSEEARNPFSGYVYHNGSRPQDWNLPLGQFVNVTGIMLNPAKWGDESAFSHQASYALFILEGAQDQKDGGLALFPEILKSELHPIRSTIEAYSSKGILQGKEEASANGYCLHAGNPSSNRFRVTTENGIAEYCIDRWD